ncbi:NUDIX hydrolase [Amylibacter sp. IMCC11727]|uniref:NUDIX hydrolase n=1 Tax=Amylibacter sp. IMCC11727 TaxID=3039851 RepID=UPI00244DA5A3|nr:NUDIX hydrolase [Amylibacter sp. IMCC11727]WGI20987.1 NUDIX hydrolase [Amylibacter sp. IMCC11727]
MSDTLPKDVPIKNAATVILVRDAQDGPQVLMGQRGKAAVFMPNKFVFPGGGLDAADAEVTLNGSASKTCMTRLTNLSDDDIALPLLAAAIREMWEETGHAIGTPSDRAAELANTQPENWRSFFQSGHLPDPSGLEFIFRAVTPPGRPRRFDARFFLGRADLIQGDLDDFSRAEDELSHLQWIPLSKSREFDLPFITEVVLAEVQNRLANPDADHPVPFFSHDGERSQFLSL